MKTKIFHSKTLQFVNIVALVLALVMNFLSNALPLNGRTAGEISDALPSFLHRQATPFPSGVSFIQR
ncbi:MAG: hypothetical protein IPJ90_08915 [Anaerolineaceae bacterium]|nr:hypothetical protein [Anaerolineaceae bacterium]